MLWEEAVCVYVNLNETQTPPSLWIDVIENNFQPRAFKKNLVSFVQYHTDLVFLHTENGDFDQLTLTLSSHMCFNYMFITMFILKMEMGFANAESKSYRPS